MRIVIDTSSWIDYFEGSDIGEKVRSYIEDSNNELIVNVLNLSEITSLFTRKGLNLEEAKKIIVSNCRVYNFGEEFAEEAGLLHAETKKKIRDFGLIDAFVLLTARKLNTKLLTGDSHFASFKETILLR